VAVVGIVYFIMSSVEGFMRASVVRHISDIIVNSFAVIDNIRARLIVYRKYGRLLEL